MGRRPARTGVAIGHRSPFWLGLLVAIVLVSALCPTAAADDLVLEWSPPEAAWQKHKLVTGAAARTNNDLDEFLATGPTAPRSGSVDLGRPFFLGLQRIENEAGIDLFVMTRSKQFKSCDEGGASAMETSENLKNVRCSDITFQGLPAIRVSADVEIWPSHENLIEADLGSGEVLAIYSLYRNDPEAGIDFTGMFERFVKTLRIRGRAAPQKRTYHGTVHVRRNVRPGEYLAPTVTVYDQNGTARDKDVVHVVFWFNGREGETHPWDGSTVHVRADVSMKGGQGFEVKTVVPAWRGTAAHPTAAPRPTPAVLPPVRNVPGIVPIDEDAGNKPAPGPVPGFKDAGRLPGPRSIGEAVVSILGPAAISLIAALFGGNPGGAPAPPAPPSSPPPGAEPPPLQPPAKPRRRKRPTKRAAPPPVPPPAGAPGKDGEKTTAVPQDRKDGEETKEKPEKETKEKEKKARKKPKKKEGYWTHVFHRVRDGVKDLVKDSTQAAKDIYKDPSLVLGTLKNSAQEVGDGLKAAGHAVGRGVRYVGKGVAHILKHPLDTLRSVKHAGGEVLDTAKEIFLHPVDFAHSLGYAVQEVGGAVSKVGKAVLHTVEEAVNDPDKLVDLVKALTGIEDFEKSMESNRSLGSRIGHSLLGTLGIYGAAEGAAALGKGTSKLLASGGREAAVSLSDDAARLAVKAGRSGEGLADDAARAAARAEDAGESLSRKAEKLRERGNPARTAPSVKEGARDFVEAPHVVPDTSGYAPSSQRYIQEFAEENNVQIYTRPTTPRAAEMIKNGEAIPKPMFIKNKTINGIDAKYLGASEENIGKVGSFKPRRPTAKELEGLSSSEQQKVFSRYHQRMNEYHDQASHLLENADRCYVKDGVIHDRLTGKPYTGDIDIYAIRGPHGEKLPPEVVHKLEQKLARERVQSSVMHGAHENWDMSHLSGNELRTARGIDHTIRQSHGRGGEALVTYKPGAAKPSAAYTDTTILLGDAP